MPCTNITRNNHYVAEIEKQPHIVRPKFAADFNDQKDAIFRFGPSASYDTERILKIFKTDRGKA